LPDCELYAIVFAGVTVNFLSIGFSQHEISNRERKKKKENNFKAMKHFFEME